MARREGFDRQAVVRGARTLFWRVGYEGASIADLEAATGLRRSSLYNSFGSKRGLFDAAVTSYLDEVIRPRLAPLQAAVVSPQAVLTYLTGLRDAFDDTASLPAGNGCLLVNTAGAPIADEPQIAAVIADYRDELQGAVARGVVAHCPALDTDQAARLSQTLTGLVIAAFALARIDPAQSRRSLDTAMALLDASPAI